MSSGPPLLPWQGYPLYQRGNPQLRVFLPNFFMKIVKPRDPLPANVVQFHVSMKMTKNDIKNYLEKIYNVPVEHIVTHVRMGNLSRTAMGGYVVKDDDYKVAYITLPKGEKFEFPNLFPEAKEQEREKQKEDLKLLEKEWKQKSRQNTNRPGVPSWFGL
ncbi:putative 39S ribosomal protein L23, mitochondrial [Portunus trituberculatus]|uniref:Large ribosomal subunit protein uL23m n=1 Tax=Portunus trituberculatus TaxID=210409 RepID=A0A5B7DNW1_PORTR|nr:putative 39S ribosomal protein L23, mitochondrial [Portunus trituberculatus]